VVDGGERLHRVAPQLGGPPPRGVPEREHGGDDDGLGQVEELAQLGLLADGDGRHDAPEADVVGREQEAPRERVDRRAADQRVPVEVAVEGGEVAEIGGEHQEQRHLVELLGEPRRGRTPLRELAGACPRRGLGVAVGDGRERREPGLHLRQVLVPPREVEVAQRDARVGIAHDDHVPRLAVPTVRREPGRVEQLVQDVVGHRLGPEVADGAGAAQGLGELHGARQ
jgi:hypothetical protein